MIDCNITINYFAEKRRMMKRAKNGPCELGCSNCPLCSINNNKGQSCTGFEMLYPKKAVKAVQEWSNANPPRTYLTEFLKHYPNVQFYDNGTPKGICPYHLGLMNRDDCKRSCIECWNQAIPVEESENNDSTRSN